MLKKLYSTEEIEESRLEEARRCIKLIRLKLKKEPTYSMDHVDAIAKRVERTLKAFVPQLDSLHETMTRYNL